MDVSREIIDALKEYHQLVVKWNKVMNIVSQNSVKDLWERHIIDSLQLLKFINNSFKYSLISFYSRLCIQYIYTKFS